MGIKYKKYSKIMFCIALVVIDTDGSAFITKAEFDSLKNNFQAQIDSYNTSIDSKIDGAIAAYLASVKVNTTGYENALFAAYNPSGTFYDIYGDGDLKWEEGHCFNHLILNVADQRKYSETYSGNSICASFTNKDSTIKPFTERLGTIEKSGSDFSFLFTGTCSSIISIFGGATYLQNSNLEMYENMQAGSALRWDGNATTPKASAIEMVGDDFPGAFNVWVARGYAKSYESDTPLWGVNGDKTKPYICFGFGTKGLADALKYFGPKYTDNYWTIQTTDSGKFRPSGFTGSAITFNVKAALRCYMSDLTFSRAQTNIITRGFYTTGTDTNRMRLTDTMNTAWCNDTDITGHTYPDSWVTLPDATEPLTCADVEVSVNNKPWLIDECVVDFTGSTVKSWGSIPTNQWPVVNKTIPICACVSSVAKDVFTGNDRNGNSWSSNLRKANGITEVWPYPGFTTKVTNYKSVITTEGASAYMFMDRTNSSKINSSRTRKDSNGTNYLDVTTGIPIVATTQKESYEYEVTNPNTTDTMVVCLSDGPIYTYSNTGSNWLQVTASGAGVSTTNSTFVNIQPGKTATIKFNAPNTNTVVFLSFSKKPASGLPDFKPINKAQLSTTLMATKE